MAIVDYNLFKQLGSDAQITLAALTVAYKYSDEILRRTDFGDCRNCGIVIKEFRIHTDYTDEVNHYNSRNVAEDKNPFALLDTMRYSKNSLDFYDYCLVHLNCKRSFQPRMVGLSYWAMVKADHGSAGVCGVYYNKRHRPSPSNLLFTAVLKDFGIQLINHGMVTTHEIGHSWGSHHDNRTNGCGGGPGNQPYLMGHNTLPGSVFDTVQFSPCSIRSISAHLKKKRRFCFHNKTFSPSACLDAHFDIQRSSVQKIESKGLSGMAQRDGNDSTQNANKDSTHNVNKDPTQDANSKACCGESSLLTSSTDVKNIFYIDRPCCMPNCTIAPAGHPCEIRSHLLICFPNGHGVCSGKDSQTCTPLLGALRDGTSCSGQRECHSGRCLSQCKDVGLSKDASQKMLPCQSLPAEEMCALCSYEPAVHRKDKKAVKCMITNKHLRDGFPCDYNGTCLSGNHMNNRRTSSALQSPRETLEMAQSKRLALTSSGPKTMAEFTLLILSATATISWATILN